MERLYDKPVPRVKRHAARCVAPRHLCRSPMQVLFVEIVTVNMVFSSNEDFQSLRHRRIINRK
jgi:hypothetical protein